ncbi:hypothetical protein [Methylobacterium nonmethylotrophicum]|uniref:Uncharacterized protein n=1 Tax=Methylobacterium nonmethylotrophicum TaxID=1141884 RepID=A0A4Z0NQM0_9HYPH|nr:hypothetical protein [Methylobacterium nonmethylotrophicum]TGD99314.1 hypothetical protein EU555_12365 [Methylobacterium nonmethylotrophicum]
MFGRRREAAPADGLIRHHVRLNRDGAEQEGCLIYRGDRLVSVAIRLEPGTPHPPEHRHKWRVAEIDGPGEALAAAPLFDTPDAVADWIARRLPHPAPRPWLDPHLLP